MAGRCGFVEIPHTADLALQVWADDLSGLFATAAEGMYVLMGVTTQPDGGDVQTIELTSGDLESLLVAFLSELLYFVERAIAFTAFDLQVTNLGVFGNMAPLSIRGSFKEIKAVTFHGLEIKHTGEGFTATIVFDV